MLTLERIARLPKAELHVHLDGSLRPETMIELAGPARVKLPSHDVEQLQRYMLVSDARNLEDYLQRFDITVSLLQTPEAIERVAWEMVEDASRDNLRYLEVRYDPHLSTHGGLSMDEVVAAERRGFDRGERDFGIRTGIINCTLRHYDPARSVVNRFNRAHDVANLFIVDGSSLVTSARQQPTATIQALAYRAAETAANAAKKGEL